MNKAEHIKELLSYLVLILLFLPMLQFFFGFQVVIDLNGISAPAENPVWSREGWLLGDYQNKKGAYWKEKFGGRESLLRLNSDRIFSWYAASTNKEVVVGKENYLFETQYIDEYCGNDFIGRAKIREKVSKLKDIQEQFKLLGKALIVVIAPSKARFYSEYIPNHYVVGDSTNYTTYLDEIRMQGLYIFDANNWFLSMKPSALFPLMPKTGTHWSDYGVTFFADSLLNYMDKVLNKDVSELIWDSLEISDTTRYLDNDIEKLLNLSFAIETPQLAYPKVSYDTVGKYKPYVLAIGDSFYGTYYFLKDTAQDCYSTSSYWYYYSSMHPESRKRKDSDIKQIAQKDVIILLATTASLEDFAWGAIDDLHDYVNMSEEEIIAELKNEIRETPAWFASVEEKAKKEKVSVDSMLYLDAVFIIDQRKLKKRSH